MRRAAALLLLLCAAPAPAREDAARLFERLEQALLAARHVRIESQAVAQGAFQAQLAGRVELRPANHLRLRYAGRFGDAVQVLELDGDADGLRLARNDQGTAVAAAPETNRAVLLGLTRMGLMHNLARLTGLHAPDRAAGGVADWVQVRRLRYLPPREAAAGPSALALAFDIHVGGRRTAQAVLWLDEETELPLRRVQTVRFAQGTMTVEEDYGEFRVE